MEIKQYNYPDSDSCKVVVGFTWIDRFKILFGIKPKLTKFLEIGSKKPKESLLTLDEITTLLVWLRDYSDELHLGDGVTAQRLIKRILPSLKELSKVQT